MKHIVIEGPDASGKSTLAEYLAKHLGLIAVEGKGPPKEPRGEIVDRSFYFLKTLEVDNPMIHVRCSIISESIYGNFRHRPDRQNDIPPAFVDRLLKGTHKPYLIICKGSEEDFARDHVENEKDTPPHKKLLDLNSKAILGIYRQWHRHADFLYDRHEPGDPCWSMLQRLRNRIEKDEK